MNTVACLVSVDIMFRSTSEMFIFLLDRAGNLHFNTLG